MGKLVEHQDWEGRGSGEGERSSVGGLGGSQAPAAGVAAEDVDVAQGRGGRAFDLPAAGVETAVAVGEFGGDGDPARSPFVDEVRRRAVGAEVVRGISPDQKFIQLVHEQLVETMGGANAPLA
ncbi:MAG: hypothetical protein ACK559_09740, partial [bacterium]